MLRQFSYLLIAILLISIASCSQREKDSIRNENTGNYPNTYNSNINIIEYNNTAYINTSNSDTSFLYQAVVTTNIGSFINNNISEIAPLTSNVPQTESYFSITYTNEIPGNQKTPVILNVVFDNDIFNNTDYYYTNGVNIELISPLAARSPLSGLLVGLPRSQINLYGFSIKQNIYTPVNPDIEEVSVGDRPFSAFLTIGQFRESYNLQKSLSVKSSISFGVLGPASMGGIVQSSIHDIEPVGWNNQINNTIVFDYSLKIEKGIISTPNIEFNVTAGGNIGTIFNKINTGLYFRTGSFIPVLKGIKANNNTFQYWFFVTGETNLVFYDATLQGGLFNKSNPYTIQSTEINRFVVNVSVGFALYYKKVGVELQNFYLSPEFKNAYDFRWGRIKLIFQL